MLTELGVVLQMEEELPTLVDQLFDQIKVLSVFDLLEPRRPLLAQPVLLIQVGACLLAEFVF